MSQYKELADRLDRSTRHDAYMHAVIAKAIAILRSLDAQPVAEVMVMGSYRGKPILGCVLHSDSAKVGDKLYAAPVAAQPTFEKGSWQHAVDDQLVGFGRTSQEFGSPHDAVRWLIEQEVQAAQPTREQAQRERMEARQWNAKAFNFPEYFAALQRAMQARNATPADVSRATGVSATTLTRMKEGRRPDAASLAALSAWAGLNPAAYVKASPATADFDLPAQSDEVAAQPSELDELRKQKDGAYFERNQVVAALAKCFPSGVAKTAIEGWSEDWHGCVYIDLPTGQVSWHFHDSQAYLFKDLPPYAGKWDGHDTPEKYRRVNALAAQPSFAKGSWQHAVDDQLVGFGRTSQEFGSPHEAVRWLIEQEVQAAQPTEQKKCNLISDEDSCQATEIIRCLTCHRHVSGPCNTPAQPQQAKPEPLTADDLKEPKNGKQWRVEWWNESCRMMLPADSKLDGFVSYKNGTLQFTIKKTPHGIKEQG